MVVLNNDVLVGTNIVDDLAGWFEFRAEAHIFLVKIRSKREYFARLCVQTLQTIRWWLNPLSLEQNNLLKRNTQTVALRQRTFGKTSAPDRPDV